MPFTPKAVRRTKIVTTLGPATDAPGVLRALVAAGADVMRINFSHGSAEDHARRIVAVREAAAELAVAVGAGGGRRVAVQALAAAAPLVSDGGFVYVEAASPVEDPPATLGLWRQGRAGAVHYQLLRRGYTAAVHTPG